MTRSATTHADEMEDQAATAAAGRLVEFVRLQPVSWVTRVSEKDWEPVQEVLEADSKATLDGLCIKSRPGQFFALVLNATFAMVLVPGLLFVSGYRLDVVAYLAITTVVARMLPPLTKGVLYASEADNAVVALRTIVSILDTGPPPEPSPEQAREPKGTDIALRDVPFSYEERRPILGRMSLTAEQGRVTTFAGPSGAGRSTVLHLVARFWDVTTGTMSISGADVHHLPIAEITAMTLVAPQKVYLFDTIIRENLRITRPDVTDEKLEEAVRRASFDRVIEALPHGWGTPIGPDGAGLSGEKRQRVSIARAFLKDAPILLLDEITPALDGKNESAITEVTRELSRGRTVSVIVHRLSTIRQADQIVFLEPSPNGARVAQAGVVLEFIAQGGPFRGLAEVYTAASRR